MLRLLFEKTGEAVYISHLDLMRLFQRAFKRAGLLLVHTQGFNPRPSVSIALPLSVGVESRCELLDFDLEGEIPPFAEIQRRLNAALVRGVSVRQVYDSGAKVKCLAYLDVLVLLEYDSGIPEDAAQKLCALFSTPEIVVEKRGKNGIQPQDIAPMIRSAAVRQADRCTLQLSARICCQNPTLNPALLVAAIDRYAPELTPNFSRCTRLEVYDTNENLFR